MIRAAAVTFSASVLLLAGCGGSGHTSSVSVPGDRAMKGEKGKGTTRDKAAARAQATIVGIVGSQFGRIVADARGQAFYLFGKENSNRSRCYGECAKRWPPALIGGQPQAGRGAQARLLGTIRRRDGRLQLSYAGHPLYYYDGDAPGRVLCHNVDEFGGRWRVIRPNGQPAR
jgi:predicted lipoprotein with Yx(FWY)xxD motif